MSRSTGSIRAGKNVRALDLAEPVRVAVGSGESIKDAAARLRDQESLAAPIVRSGRAVGILTRSSAESALRFGLGDVMAVEISGSGHRHVSPAARRPALLRAARGTAPGLLIAREPKEVRGIVLRHRLGAGVLSRGPALGPAVEKLLPEELVRATRAAGKLASRQGRELYLVGGVVRDVLLGRTSKDLDFVVDGDGASFAHELSRSFGGRVTAHGAFGTAVLRLPSGNRIDVASLRRDHYAAPAALPSVEPGTLLDDLLRRDVTINSMAIAIGANGPGRLVDELAGRRDLAAGLLRVHHALSITEDPTRAFRIARYAARFGFAPAVETTASLKLALRARAFEALTGERLLREFGLIAAEPAPAAALAACARMGLFPRIGPALRWGPRVRQGIERLFGALEQGLLQPLSDLPPPPLLMIMVLTAGARPVLLETLAERLRVRGEAADRLISLPRHLAHLASRLTGSNRPSRIVRACEESPPEALAVAWALSTRVAGRVEQYLSVHRRVVPRVTGEDLRGMGVPPGPGIGQILRRLRSARLDGLLPDAASEARLCKRLVDGWKAPVGHGK